MHDLGKLQQRSGLAQFPKDAAYVMLVWQTAVAGSSDA
jgi:hypothetical protein